MTDTVVHSVRIIRESKNRFKDQPCNRRRQSVALSPCSDNKTAVSSSVNASISFLN